MICTIHETDLFRPHQDPDDHWDLACQFALAHMGLHRLQGVLIDHPPGFVKGDPDIQAVQQLNVLTGLHTPVGIGAPDDKKTAASSGAAMLKEALEHAPEPVTIHIVGSSRDVAQALKANRPLFAAKCRAIYLNAGSGNQNRHLEYNVELDPAVASYTASVGSPKPLAKTASGFFCAAKPSAIYAREKALKHGLRAFCISPISMRPYKISPV